MNARAIVLVDTLHPIYEGRAFRWNRGTAQAEVLEYGRTREGANAEGWRRSPLYYMVETNRSFLRRRLTEPSTSDETPPQDGSISLDHVVQRATPPPLSVCAFPGAPILKHLGLRGLAVPAEGAAFIDGMESVNEHYRPRQRYARLQQTRTKALDYFGFAQAGQALFSQPRRERSQQCVVR